VLSRLKGSLIVLSALTVLPAAVDAQVPALNTGSILISGQASFVVQDVEGSDDNATTLAILPSLQFFVMPGLAIGGELRFLHSSFDDRSSTSYGIGPAVSYYFVRDGNAHPFLRGSVRYEHSSTDISPGGDVESDQLGLRASAGLLFLLSDAVGVDAALFYDRSSRDAGNGDLDINAFGLAVGISAFLF
jgi:hypothetical protein